jgi:hypothetical protein
MPKNTQLLIYLYKQIVTYFRKNKNGDHQQQGRVTLTMLII